VFQFAPAIRCAPCSGRAVIVTMPPRVPPALSVRNGPRELVIQGSSGGSVIAGVPAPRTVQVRWPSAALQPGSYPSPRGVMLLSFHGDPVSGSPLPNLVLLPERANS